MSTTPLRGVARRFGVLTTALVLGALSFAPDAFADTTPSATQTPAPSAATSTPAPGSSAAVTPSSTPPTPASRSSDPAHPQAPSSSEPSPVSSTRVPAAASGLVAGVVFGDKNGNGTFDSGEGLAGVHVSLTSQTKQTSVSTVTDSAGRFTFGDQPAGMYSITTQDMPGGWLNDHSVFDVTVDGSKRSADIHVRAVRPVSERLTASAAFEHATYKPGDTAQVRVIISNTGTAALAQVRAHCNEDGGGGPFLAGTAKWGELIYPGVTLKPGETRTFVETGTVARDAGDYGVVMLACDIGPDSTVGMPQAIALAKVPGKIADTAGQIYDDRNSNSTVDPGEAIADTKVGLVDPFTGKVIAKAVSDKSGRVNYTALPTGVYEVRVFGPWAPVAKDPFIFVGACGPHCGTGWALAFTPGPNVPETDTVTPTPVTVSTIKAAKAAATAPAAQQAVSPAAKSSGLASTGANVIGLTLAGLAIVLIGGGALFFARRSRSKV